MRVVLCVPVLSLSAYFIGQDKEKMPYKNMSLKTLLKSCSKKKKKIKNDVRNERYRTCIAAAQSTNRSGTFTYSNNLKVS